MDEATKKLLLYITTKQFNLTEDEATALLFDGDKLKDDAGDAILSKAADTVARLKKERDDYFNRGHQKATKEIMPAVESKFRELTEFTEEAADFEDLVKKYREHAAKGSKGSKLTDDDVKKHPLYLQLESSRVPKDEYDKLRTEYEGFKKNTQRESILSRIRDKAWEIVAAKNPIMSENQAVATNRKNDFLQKFNAFDFEEQDGQILVLQEGKRLEDAHGNPRQFSSFVLDMASLNFDFRAQEDKGNGGNKGGGGPAIITETPRTKAELNAVLDKYDAPGEDNVKKKLAAVDFYEKNKTD